MAMHSVNDVASLINNQINFHEKIQECLSKASAMAEITLGGDFLDYRHSTINEYLSALFDIIIDTKDLHQQALDILLKSGRLLHA